MHGRPIQAGYPYAGELDDDVDNENWPGPCWDQYPEESTAAQWYDPIVRWADQQFVELDGTPLSPITVQIATKQLVQYQTRKPYDTRVLLNATSPDIVASLASLYVQWTVYVGAGSSQQTYVVVQQVQPEPQAPGTALIYSLPAEVVRVQGLVVMTNKFLPQAARVTCVAQAAPTVYLPDAEVGPRRVRGSVREQGVVGR